MKKQTHGMAWKARLKAVLPNLHKACSSKHRVSTNPHDMT